MASSGLAKTTEKGKEAVRTNITRRSSMDDSLTFGGEDDKPAQGRKGTDINRPNMTRIALVGKTGVGKSSSGNTIFGRKAFRDAKSSSSVTKECCKITEKLLGRQVVVVDTPGIFDTNLCDRDLMREISKCINMTSPGPHAIVLVMDVGPFTQEEKLTVQKIRTMFGEESKKYTVILFTHGDELDCGIEPYLNEGEEDLKTLVEECGGRYHVFDNTKMDDRSQVTRLFEKIDAMVTTNGQGFYTNNMYEEVEGQLDEMVDKLMKQYREQVEKLEKELPEKYQELCKKRQNKMKALEEIENELKDLELVDQNKIMQIMEDIRYYEVKLRSVRQEVEETTKIEISAELYRKLKDLHV